MIFLAFTSTVGEISDHLSRKKTSFRSGWPKNTTSGGGNDSTGISIRRLRQDASDVRRLRTALSRFLPSFVRVQRQGPFTIPWGQY